MPTQAPTCRTPSDLAQGYKSTIGLFTAIREVFGFHGLAEGPALLATHFVFSTWFANCLPFAPCLLITGPRPEGHLLLDLLECVVRTPLPLVELTRSSFLLLPKLKPTLLVDQEGLTRSNWKLLRASNYPNAQMSSKDGQRKIYCAKAIYCGNEEGDDSFDDSMLRIELSPSRGRLPLLDEKDKRAISKDLQPKLRAYRRSNLATVSVSNFDVPEFASPIRILSRVLGAPIVDAPELQVGLRLELRKYQEDTQARSWSDTRFVVIEALLTHCHRGQAKVHVGEIASTTNAIRKGRGEATEVEAREIGTILRRHGLSSKRDSEGYAIPLDSAMHRHVHDLGRRFGLIGVEQAARCPSCEKILETGGVINESATPSEEAS